ncbi:hypothetical protein EWM59_27160, partial [Emticicia agri]
MKQLYTLLLLLATKVVFAQSTTLTPGTVLPSMTTAQRTALASPTNGTLVFDTGTQSYWYRQAGVWVELPKGGNMANYWQLSGMAGNEITHTNSGGFWSKNPVAVPFTADTISNPPTVPVNEAGTRLMWIPNRSAFRAGTVSNTSIWSASKIGLFSFASGFDTQANGKWSTAMGNVTTASGLGSVALGSGNNATNEASVALGALNNATGYVSTTTGYLNSASGYVSTAMGYNTHASSAYTTAIGNYTTASGEGALATGGYTTASGSYATAMGAHTWASGQYATAMGYVTAASGRLSTAMGYGANTDYYAGAFIIGDSDPNNEGVTYSGATDQFVARYWNGYYLMTS